ncbi:ionotropic receptor 75a-like [Anthonomus grandis grandis]|uniref:ionotropic receptor 75a-like n=1 Tax=Anthonomus grandis grandis TaxID=2921223 RepID=UPI002165E228|nr:ionotropic receptor 75a-like [Anthonomus grandis grandis]
MYKTILREGPDVRLVFLKVEPDALAKINTKKYEKFSYFLDMQCHGAVEILKEASTIGKFGMLQYIYSWYLLGIDQEVNMTDYLTTFRTVKTRMDMDVKLFQPYNERSYNIYEIFKPGIGRELQIRHIGKLINSKIILHQNESYYNSRKNMTGVLIRSANVIRYPFKTSFHDYMVAPKLMKYDIYSKFHYQLFLGLADIHGFRFNTVLPFSWFGNTSSGEDGGLAKLLWDDTIDIGSAGRLKSIEDLRKMHKLPFRSCFYFRNPGIVKPNFKEVLKPFTKQSWIITLYVTAIVCVCIEISYFVEKKMRGLNERTWLRSVFIVIAAFSQQGLDTVPNQLPGRIIFLHLLICSLLLYNYYTSSLVSSLISTEPEVLKTIKELLDSQLQVGIEYQPYTITYMLDRVKQDHYLDLLNKTKIYQKDTPNIFDVDEGINKVHKGGFAFHTESITAYPIIGNTFEQDTICDLAEITLINSDTSLMAQKRSQYKKLFQISLRKMWQTGIIRKLHKTWVTSKPECLSSARVISVGVNDLFLPYFILGIGVFFSLCLFFFEIFWKKIRYGMKWILNRETNYSVQSYID